MKFTLNPPQVLSGERATLDIIVPAKEIPKEIQIENEGLSSVQVNDELLEQEKDLVTLGKDTGRVQDDWHWRYYFTAYSPGKYRIPPIEIKLGGNTFSTEARELQVVTTRPDEDEALRPEYGELSPPCPWQMLLVVFLGLLAGSYLFLWVKKKFRQLPAIHIPVPAPKPIPEEDPKHWLRRRLDALKQDFLKNEKKKGLVDEISLTVKEFYARFLKLPARAYTTRELQEKHPPSLDKLSNELTAWDEFKYSEKKLSPEELTEKGLEKIERSLL